jgi:5-methylcytosine-specific restriction endonuclease McrA
MNEQLRFFAALSDARLLAEVDRLAATQRTVNASLIASLAELDARKLYLGLGFSSLHTYCTQHLHLSEAAAYNRIEAARTARRFPVVLDLLASGDVTMTTVALLSKYLTEENHLELLDAARHKTKRQVQAQVAELDPRPDLDSLVVPLGNGRYRIEITVADETYRDLRRLQDLMRHTIPTGDPAPIVSRALSHLRAHVERQKLAEVRRPRRATGASRTRHVPAAITREVWKRDEAQCAFVGSAGRCPERSFLEVHHLTPFAAGGPTTVDNLQLRCRAHNQYEAEQYFGRTT